MVSAISYTTLIHAPRALFNGSDQLEKTICKMAAGIFEGWDYFVQSSPITHEAKVIFGGASKWLAAVLLGKDFITWTNGQMAKTFKQDVVRFFSIFSYQMSHLFETLKLGKELGIQALSKFDAAIGRFSFLGLQLSLKLIKDLSAISGAAFGLVHFMKNLLFKENGAPRPDFLARIFTGKVKETEALQFFNSFGKIYLISSVILGSPYSWLTLVLGFTVGYTTARKNVINYQKEQQTTISENKEKSLIIDKLPKISEKEAFGRHAASPIA